MSEVPDPQQLLGSWKLVSWTIEYTDRDPLYPYGEQAEGLGRMRITLDVGGYRLRREKSLRELVGNVAKRVLDSARPYHFEPMSAMERRVVHMAVTEIEGLRTESEGEGRRRHVVVFRVDG